MLLSSILASDPDIDFIMTLDADMILADNLLETVLNELRSQPTIVLCQSRDLPQDVELAERHSSKEATLKATPAHAARSALSW